MPPIRKVKCETGLGFYRLENDHDLVVVGFFLVWVKGSVDRQCIAFETQFGGAAQSRKVGGRQGHSQACKEAP